MDCALMETVAKYQPFIALLIINITIGIFAIPMLLYIMLRISKNQLYHLNTRILLVVHGALLVLNLFNRIIFHGSDLYRWMVIMPQSSACDIISTAERCIIMRLGVNIGLWFCICSTPTIVLERYLALRNIDNYQSDKKSWVLLLLFQTTMGSALLAMVYGQVSLEGFKYYCLAAKAEFPLMVMLACTSNTIVLLLSNITYRHLRKKNEKLNQIMQQEGCRLTTRYQIEESLRCFEILSLPFHTMFYFQFTYSTSGLILFIVNHQLSRPLFLFLSEAITFIPEYSIVFIILFLYNEKKFKIQAKESLNNKILVHPEAYFAMVHQNW